MEEKIYNVLLEILEELRKQKRINKNFSKDEKIEKYVDAILNFKYNGITKSDLRAMKIVSGAEFKAFWDENVQEIIDIMKNEHNIFLSRCVDGYYLYKKECKKY